MGIKMSKTRRRAVRRSRQNSEYYTRNQTSKKEEVDTPAIKEEKV